MPHAPSQRCALTEEFIPNESEGPKGNSAARCPNRWKVPDERESASRKARGMEEAEEEGAAAENESDNLLLSDGILSVCSHDESCFVSRGVDWISIRWSPDVKRCEGGRKESMAGATRGGVNDPNDPRNEYLNIAALTLWLFGIHLNAFVVIIVLFFLPNPWAITALVLWLTQILLPLYNDTPFTNRVARFISKYAPTHFPIETHVEDIDALDPKRAYVLAVEPHSVLPISIIALTKHYGLLPLNKVKALASSAIFWTPVLRHVWSWLGLVPASRKYYKELLQDGYSTIVIPGGVQECLYLEYGHETIFLKKRYGFVRGAIEAGAPLVPCFCFGQSEVYHYWKPSGQWYAHLSRAIGFTPLVFWGMYGSPIPYPHPMYFVIGKPIEVVKNPNPTHEEVAEVHKKFIAAMEELFERHKVAAGYKETTLTVR